MREANAMLPLKDMTVTPLLNVLTAKPLTGPNFLEWKRNLGYVLDAEDYHFVLTIPAPAVLTADSTEVQKEESKRWHKADCMAKAYMMTTMTSGLQQQHQSLDAAAAIMTNLEELFGESDRSTRFEIMRQIMSSKMTEGASLCEHVLGMINHFNELDVLGGGIMDEAKVDMILHTLPKSYENFRLNAIMSKKVFTLNELLNELVAAEGVMGKSPQALASSSRGFHVSPKGGKKWKGPAKGKKGEESSGSKRLGPTGGIKKPKEKGGKCFKCKKSGHWKANCPLLKKAQGVPADKGSE